MHRYVEYISSLEIHTLLYVLIFAFIRIHIYHFDSDLLLIQCINIKYLVQT